MILHDPYALNRRWWDWTWEPDENSRDWTVWDFVLADTFQAIMDFTDSESGQWMPYDQSGDVDWEVGSKFSGSIAAIREEEKRRGELKPGESLYAYPVFRDPENRPTLMSWLKDIEEGKADLRPAERAEARPPTLEELRAVRAAKNSDTVD